MLMFLASIHALSTLFFFFFFYEYTCFPGCLRWSPSVSMALFLLTSGIRPSLEGVSFRQWRVFKQSSRNPTRKLSPVWALAPPASFHINTPVDPVAPKASGAKRGGEKGTRFGGCWENCWFCSSALERAWDASKKPCH